MPPEDSAEPSPSRSLDAIEDHIREELIKFTRTLRNSGADVPPNASLLAAEVLATVGLANKDKVQAGLKAALLTRVEDVLLFEQLFETFWTNLQQSPLPHEATDTDEVAPETEEVVDESPLKEPEIPDESTISDDEAVTTDTEALFLDTQTSTHGDELQTARYSPTGPSSPIRALYTEDDRSTETAVRQLTQVVASLDSRRHERTQSGRHPDIRKALRKSVATGGLLTSIPDIQPKQTEVRGAVFVDVSRSVLDVLNRDFLIRFLQLLHKEWRRIHIFLFDTAVREVTSAFDVQTTAASYRALEQAEAEWGGGTRIGNAFETVRETNPYAIDRRTVVLVISDGLEMGQVTDLEAGISWLARQASAVLWLNPLAKSPDYEPTAAGMAAAMPYIDGLFPFTDETDIEYIAEELRQYSRTTRIGYPYRPT